MPSAEGFGVQFMGGAAWGGHTCPDVPPVPVRLTSIVLLVTAYHK